MKNFQRYNDRVAVGGVPNGSEIITLSAMGYRTLIDLRNEEEKRRRDVWRRARETGVSYIDIPIYREDIQFDDVIQFYFAVHERESALIYAFSDKGRRPVAFLLLFDAVANDRPIDTVFERARQLGQDLEGDGLLQRFLVEFNDRWRMKEILGSVGYPRPDRHLMLPNADSGAPGRTDEIVQL